MLVTISGVDCCGKTTQINRFIAARAEAGQSVRKVWYRPGYSGRLDRLRATVRRISPTVMPAGQSQARERVFQRPGVSSLWMTVALIDLFIEYAVVLRWRMFSADLVLCDRYIYDADIDLDLRFGPRKGIVKLLARLIYSCCPKPDVAILLMLPWEELSERVLKKREPFPDLAPVRAERYRRYGALAREGRLTVVSAIGSQADVHERLSAAVTYRIA